MKQPKIKVGEKQPVPCDKCGYEGYSYSDYMKIHYVSYHDAEGYYMEGAYSESTMIINNGVTPYCSNCGDRLKFKLIRIDREIVKEKTFIERAIL